MHCNNLYELFTRTFEFNWQHALVQNRPFLPQGRPSLPQGRPPLPKETPFLAQERPSLPQERPFLPQERPFLAQERPSLPQERPFLPQERPFLPQERPSLPQERPSLPKENITRKDDKKPGVPIPQKKTHNTIKLTWPPPKEGNQNIQSYTVLFSEADDFSDQWNTSKTKGAEESLVISGLASRKVYSFKVRADYADGVCVTGEVSDPIQTNPHLAMEVKAKSECICKSKEGAPAIYRLPMVMTMKKEQERISKCSIGQENPTVQEKVLMVVGATGAGKSTLINGLANYIMGVEWKDDFRFKLVVDAHEAGKSQVKSQTRWITAYTIHQQEGSPLPYTLTIVDTPGFGDTDGLERDMEITRQVKEFFSMSNGLDHIDGIGFVTQSSLARLTPTQQYVYDSILSIFGKDIAKNIFLMVTFADGQKPPVVAAAEAAGIPCSNAIYKFNNSALFAPNDAGDDEDNFDKMFWKMGYISFKKFFSKFEEATSVSLKLTREVLSERDRLQTILKGLEPQINEGLAQLDEMRQEELILQQREAEIQHNKEFKFEIEVQKHRKVDLEKGRHVTNCTHCNFTCHHNCAFANDEDKFKCSAMMNGYCQVCPDNCKWDEHHNTPYTFEYYTEKETRTSEDLKAKYDMAIDGKTKAESVMAGLEHKLHSVHEKVCNLMDRAQKCLNRLDQIALKKNPLTRTDYLDLLIRSEKQQAKPGWKQRLAYYEAAREQATMISKAKDLSGKLSSKIKAPQKSWYSRLKFW